MPKTKSALAKNPGLMLVYTYIVLFIVNSIVVYLANRWYPQAVVLGTGHITRGWAIVHSMGTLALIVTFAIPFVRWYEDMKGKMLTGKQWMIKYFILNFVGVWLIARFADNLGLGVASWRVVAVMAFVLDMAQGFAMMRLEEYRK